VERSDLNYRRKNMQRTILMTVVAVLLLATAPALAADPAENAKDSFKEAADATGEGFKEGWKATEDSASATWDATKESVKGSAAATREAVDSETD
jgi:hypothetical protein